MLSMKNRSAGLLAATLGLALFAGACGDSGTKTAATTTAATKTGASGSASSGSGAGAAPTTTAAKVDVTGTLSASGATFPKPFYEAAIADFKKAQPKATITYAGGGSGKGRTDLQSQVVDFAGSDGLVADADKAAYKGGAFLYFPTVVAPITVSYHLDGVDKLNLSPDTIAKIFQRQIKTWDDPAIVAENAGVKLSGNITVVHRSDGSGTTQNFTGFLNKAAGAAGSGVWTLKTGSTVEWPTDTQAGNANAGVAQIVKDTKGAIGYVDYSDAKASGLKFALVKNKAGKYVAATLDGASAAANGATVNADLSYDPLWADGDTTYPIAAPTWILVYVNQTDKVKGQTVKELLRFILTDGQKLATPNDYAPLPKALADKALAQLDKIQIPA